MEVKTDVDDAPVHAIVMRFEFKIQDSWIGVFGSDQRTKKSRSVTTNGKP